MVLYGLDRPLSGVTRTALELGRAMQAVDLCDLTFLTPSRVASLSGTNARFWQLLGCRRLPALMLLGGPLIALAAKRLHLDLVHDPVGISPFTLGRWAGRFRRVVTIHDAIAFRYPGCYPGFNNFLHRRYVPATKDNVDRVVTDSRYSGEDLVELVSLPREKISVVPLGIGAEFKPIAPETAQQTLARYGLLADTYILSVGAQQERKNVDRLFEAFAQVRSAFPELRLAVAGPTLWRFKHSRSRLEELGIAGAVSFLGYVPDSDLPALYSAARVFAFPSLYEGFGLPVLEAMACGAPVVCSSSSSLPEVSGEAAVQVEPASVESISRGLACVLNDSELRLSLRQKGMVQAAQFSWERTARETMAAYRTALAAAS